MYHLLIMIMIGVTGVAMCSYCIKKSFSKLGAHTVQLWGLKLPFATSVVLLAAEQHSLSCCTLCLQASLDSDKLISNSWNCTGGPEIDYWPPPDLTHTFLTTHEVYSRSSALHHCDNNCYRNDKDDVFLCAALGWAVMMCHKDSTPKTSP